MKPYRREEPRETMTNAPHDLNTMDADTTDRGPLDAGLADAEMAAADYREAVDPGYLEDAAAEPNDLSAFLQSVLFHPHLIPNVKVLLMQLLWLSREVTADDLSKATMLTPLQVQYALRMPIELGLATTRWVLVDENTGATVRVFGIGKDLSTGLAKVPAPDKQDTSTPAEADE